MKLSELKRNVDAIEKGDWVGAKYGTPIPGMGDLCFRTRGSSNADWRRLESKLVAGLPAARRVSGRIEPEDRDAISGQCLLEAGVTDWSGIEGDDGASVPYSKDQAALFFTDPAYSDVRDAALYAANLVGTAAAEALKVDAKN